MTPRRARGDTPGMSLPELASHRGGAFLWPENSLMAIRAACGFAAEQVEIDIHASRDGEPVVMHDATLERMTDGEGPVAAQDWAALRLLRVKGTGGEGVPHLRDAARAVLEGGKILRLEIKAGPDGAPYAGLTEAAAAVLPDRARCVVMSFEPATVAEAASLGGFRETVLLVDRRRRLASRAADLVAACRACGATELGVSIEAADEALVAAMHAAGLRVSVWGANHAPTIARSLALGLDAVATDDPPLAAAMRADASGLRNRSAGR